MDVSNLAPASSVIAPYIAPMTIMIDMAGAADFGKQLAVWHDLVRLTKPILANVCKAVL